MRSSPEGRGVRSLAPREHGAYGQLFVPLVTALAMGRPTVGAVAIAAAGTAVFLAHEPALVMAGKRGTRAQRECGARARRRLFWFGVLGLAAGAAAVVSVPFVALVAGAALIPAAAASAWLALRGEEKTAAGELIVAAALAGVSVPVAIAAGVPLSWSAGAWVAWMAAFAGSTLAVRAVIGHSKVPIARWRRTLPPVFAAAVALVMASLVPWWCAVAAAPMLLVAITIAASPPPPRALRRVGWTLVASSIATAAILIAGAHLVG